MRGVERGCAIERNELARATLAACLDAGILVLELHSGALREELDRGREVEALLELDQTQRVAAGVAAEALEQLLGGRDRERRCALVMQRAAADHAVRAGPPQLRVAAGELDEVCRVAHAMDGGFAEARQSVRLHARQHRRRFRA